MIGPVDFSLSSTVLSALLVALLALPVYLIVLARFPGLYGRNALQFLVSVLLMVTLWTGFVTAWSGWRRADPAEIYVGLMILGAGSLCYLEVWALLSRGYTLGLLLTLYKANRPLTEEELAQRYRGGQGLAWIVEHRLSGLLAAGLVRKREQTIALTSGLGVPIAWLYKFSTIVLGLRR